MTDADVIPKAPGLAPDRSWAKLSFCHAHPHLQSSAAPAMGTLNL